MARTFYDYLINHSYDELVTTALELGIDRTAVNGTPFKADIATMIEGYRIVHPFTRTGNSTELAIRASLRRSVNAKKNFRRERKLIFPRGR